MAIRHTEGSEALQQIQEGDLRDLRLRDGNGMRDTVDGINEQAWDKAMSEPIELLECGHPESAHLSITRGYGTDKDGKRSCYTCCQAGDIKTMQETGRIDAYLSSDSKTITNWPGMPLARVTEAWETSAGGFKRGMNITRVRAIAADGTRWYGSGPGAGMYIRLRRAK